MSAHRKTKKQKLLSGTFKKTREVARKKVTDPANELDDARTALEAMKQNLKLATQQIAEKGLLITTQIADSHGRFTVVERINPAIRVQQAAMKAIASLKRQIRELDDDVEHAEPKESILDFLKEDE
jgi:uncharacterized protein GlcG (DUF336 family)